jgi:RNA polymerase sigma-70 factor (ECF subfamily)
MFPGTLFLNSDAALVQRALDDRPEAFEELVFRYQKTAHAIARAAGVPSDAVEDVVQESFLKAFEKLPHLRSPESFGPWLLNIIRNAARNHVRGLRMRSSGEVPGERPAPPSPSLEDEDFKDFLWRKVHELPGSVRETVFLYYHEGESVRAVAKATGVSRAAVRKRLQRGRELLREKLWRELEESLREMLPSAREWHQKGRKLAILIVSSIATSWGIRAPAALGGASAGAAGRGVESACAMKLLMGGVEMAAKKHGVLPFLALCIVVGSVCLLTGVFRDDLVPARSRMAKSGVAKSTASQLSSAASAPTSEETAGDGSPEPRSSPKEMPPSIHGLVTDAQGAGISGARLVALPASEWDGNVEQAMAAFPQYGQEDFTGELQAFELELARSAEEFPRAETDGKGSYAFHDLVIGEYRVLAVAAAHLPRTDSWALVCAEESFRLDIKLPGAGAVAGRVFDDQGRSVAGASVSARRSSFRRLAGQERTDDVIADWTEGITLLGLGHTASAEDGAFRLESLEPEPHDLKIAKEGYATAWLLDVPAGNEEIEVTLSRGLAIRGRVLDPWSQPIDGAEVRLSSSKREKPSLRIGDSIFHDVAVDYDEERWRTAVTDAEGRFEHIGLAGGAFDLLVRHPGFPSRREGVRLEKTAADLGDLVLDAPQSIHGIVLDPAERPLAGARVWIVETVPGGVLTFEGGLLLDPPPLAEVRTDAGGRFSLTGLPGGVFTLHASSRDHAPVSLTSVSTDLEPVEIRLEEGATLSGRVLDGGRNVPVAGAEVTLGRGYIGDPEKRTHSGPGGEFTVPGIAIDSRKVRIRVTHPEYVGTTAEGEVLVDIHDLAQPVEVRLFPPDRIEGWIRDPAGNPVASARVRCKVPSLGRSFGRALSGPDGSFAVDMPGSLRYHALEMIASHPVLGAGRTGPIQGAIARSWPHIEIVLAGSSTLGGKIVDDSGRPVANAVVRAARMTWRDDRRAFDYDVVRPSYSGPSGAYAIAGLEPGAYRVAVHSQGHLQEVIEGVEVGAKPRVLDVTLEAGRAVEGIVVDDAGQPVAEAEVFALEVDPNDRKDPGEPGAKPRNLRLYRERRERMGGFVSASTDAAGRYRLTSLPKEDVTLVARARGHEPSELHVSKPGETTGDLVLARLSSLSGVVTHSVTGIPVSSFEIFSGMRLSTSSPDEELWPRQFAEPRGTFRIDGLRAGEHTVAVRAEGYAFWTANLMLRPGTETAVHVALEHGKTLRGMIVDGATGGGIPNAHVSLQRRDRREGDLILRLALTVPLPSTFTGADGRFEIRGLTPAEYSVSCFHPGYLEGKGPVVVIDDAEPEVVQIRMQPGGALRGRIENYKGQKPFTFPNQLTLRMIRQEDAEGGEEVARLWHYTVASDGGFQVPALPPGSYQVDLTEVRFTGEDGEPIQAGDLIEAITPLGEVEIRAGETTMFSPHVP